MPVLQADTSDALGKDHRAIGRRGFLQRLCVPVRTDDGTCL